MSTGLLAAAALLTLTAVAHSVLGERYILMRLFRRGNLPRLLGGEWFTRRTLRGAWHLTSVTWLGLAALLVLLAGETAPGREPLLAVIAALFLVISVTAALASRGKHLSWPVFLAVAVLTWLAR